MKVFGFDFFEEKQKIFFRDCTKFKKKKQNKKQHKNM